MAKNKKEIDQLKKKVELGATLAKIKNIEVVMRSETRGSFFVVRKLKEDQLKKFDGLLQKTLGLYIDEDSMYDQHKLKNKYDLYDEDPTDTW